MFRRRRAYDRIVTQFSPQGRLYQVEYALETVRRGATIMGLVCPEGVVLGGEESKLDKLQEPRSSWKLYELDRHIGAAFAGLEADARALVSEARVHAQGHRLMYGESVDVEILTKRIANVKQRCTQQIRVRPFGVSFIIGGVDKTGNRLFKTNPSGTYLSYRAVAEGAGRENVEGILEGEYKSDVRLNEAVQLTVRCLLKDLEARREEGRVRIATVPAETKRFTVLPEKEIERYEKSVKKTL